ncbi:uncharacterized protein LOC112570392 [Pomacea canaliculata]|uniref:uncharacterized protein LOC112570392 n=1 Tax=Pomacea canaliculata TaxID=400727 RepID=UPI000D739093|nr:uncharacterized protein LOC112570392 [Pomacea canaliculata]
MIEVNSTTVLCTTIDDEGLKYFDWYIFPYIDLAVTSLIPFSILIVGNSVLVWKVIQSVHVARVMTAGGCDQVNSRQKKASSLTLTLITVSMAFLLLTLPICTFLIINPDVYLQSSPKVLFTWAFCNLSWYVNSAINFYLYCLSGSRFRTEAKNLLCGPGTPLTEFVTDFKEEISDIIMRYPEKSCSLDSIPTYPLNECLNLLIPLIISLISNSLPTATVQPHVPNLPLLSKILHKAVPP